MARPAEPADGERLGVVIVVPVQPLLKPAALAAVRSRDPPGSHRCVNKLVGSRALGMRPAPATDARPSRLGQHRRHAAYWERPPYLPSLPSSTGPLFGSRPGEWLRPFRPGLAAPPATAAKILRPTRRHPTRSCHRHTSHPRIAGRVRAGSHWPERLAGLSVDPEPPKGSQHAAPPGAVPEHPRD